MYQATFRQFSLRVSSGQKLIARPFTSTRNAMAQPTQASKVISETAKAEGGPEKVSRSSQMQSQIGKTQNFEQAASEIGSKMKNAPETVTSSDAAYLKSREARAIGQGQPPSDSISAEAQRLASANKGATTTNSGPDPEERSANDRLQNFEEAVNDIAAKNPEAITKEDGDLLHSREQRAFGTTEKGGVASQAQELAVENEKKGNV